MSCALSKDASIDGELRILLHADPEKKIEFGIYDFNSDDTGIKIMSTICTVYVLIIVFRLTLSLVYFFVYVSLYIICCIYSYGN